VELGKNYGSPRTEVKACPSNSMPIEFLIHVGKRDKSQGVIVIIFIEDKMQELLKLLSMKCIYIFKNSVSTVQIANSVLTVKTGQTKNETN
jgi:hypothetical protein